MSASTKQRHGSRHGGKKSKRNKPDSTDHVPEKTAISYSTPWTPSAYTAFKALLSARLCAAIWSQISDCDETYNYWEPLHYLIHGHGFQTWEYSPAYAIRSYAYIWLYGLPLKLYVMLTQSHSLLEFYFLRLVMAFACALCEIYFYRSVCRCLGNNVGRILLCIQLFSSGMFISSSAFLPSSFAMYMTMLALGAWYTKRYRLAIFCIAASAIIGWPFAGALGIPIAFDLIVRQRRLRLFIDWSLISGVICLTPVVCIDSYYYNKLVVAPLNIILYNVFSNHGPDLYGVEPWTFYFLNGFLNYNIVFVLSLGVVPFVVLTTYLMKFLGVKFIIRQQLPVWLCLSPMFIWIAIFFTRPHKEERFLFPIYPLFSLGAAIFLDHLQKLIYSGKSTSKARNFHYTQSCGSQMIAVGFCLVFATLSFSRTLALYKGYHAPLDVYGELNQLTSDPKGQNLPSANQINVCVGKEWYRFPSNFFMPDKKWSLQFVKSEFRGQLPKPYADHVNATSIVPSNMNDRNLEEASRYVDVSKCHYLIDLDLPEESAYEPRYSEDKTHWRVIASADFLDAQRSHRFFRAFYVPFLSEQHCIYVKYNLLQSTSYMSQS